MITVFRECADQAKLEIEKNSDLPELVSNVTKTSIESVRNTPKLLPVLDEADVIDSEVLICRHAYSINGINNPR